MSRSASAILQLRPFILSVKEVVGHEDNKTILTGYVTEEGIPDFSNSENREVTFYLTNDDRNIWGKPRTLLFCKEARIYLQKTKSGILIVDAVVLGTLDEPEGSKKHPTIDKLSLEPESLIDDNVPAWQIPPRS